jgi:hypothetical protein
MKTIKTMKQAKPVKKDMATKLTEEQCKTPYVYKRHFKYLAQVGSKYLKMWATEKDAKKAVEKYLGCKVSKKLRSVAVNLDKWIERFKLIQDKFKDWYPADFTNAVEMRLQNPDFAWSSSILYHIALRGKEAKFRELMVQAWTNLPKDDRACLQCLGSVRSSENSRAAKLIHACCSQVASRMQGRSAAERDWWKRNVHRMVGFHSGWLPLLQQLKIIRKVGRKKKTTSQYVMKAKQAMKCRKKSMKKSTQKAKKAKADRKATKTRSSSVFDGDAKVEKHGTMLNYGGPNRYKPIPFSTRLHTPRFAGLAYLLRIVQAEPIPRSLATWTQSIMSVQSQAARLRAKGISSGPLLNSHSYSFLWLVRLHLIVELMAAKRRLRWAGTFELWRFAKAFPDQCKWINTLRKKKNVQTLGQLVRLLQYKRPIEFLTMDLCLSGDRELMKVEPTEIKRCSRRIATKRKDPFGLPLPHTNIWEAETFKSNM